MNNKIVLCTIWRNELKSALEWIAYHLNLGFDEIYIYDNFSDDGSRELLSILHKSGLINHVIWDYKENGSPQVSAYKHAADQVREDADWIIYIDADEFLVPYNHDNVHELLLDVIGNDQNISAITFNWKTFGSNGHSEYIPALVMDRFLMCREGTLSPNNTVKSMVKLKNLVNPHIHIHEISSGRYVNDASEDAIIYGNGMLRNPSFKQAQINHYMVKSKQEFYEKKLKGNANYAEYSPARFDRIDDDYFKRFDINEVKDENILRFKIRTHDRILMLREILLINGFDRIGI